MKVPTPMQAVAELHDTPDRWLDAWSGTPWKSGIDHLVPFRLSANADVTPFLVLNPTAWHVLSAGQDTLDNPLAVLPRTTATLCVVQFVPFHRSARGTVLDPVKNEPTAVHAFGAVHDTPLREGSDPPPGIGVLWMVQLVPFQASAQIWPVAEPTAVHAVAALQDTSLSWLVVEPAGLGVCWTVQLLPSQRSASVSWFPAGLPENPTAVQAVAAVQDTPSRKLRVAVFGGEDGLFEPPDVLPDSSAAGCQPRLMRR